jgi:hypothetical protein
MTDKQFYKTLLEQLEDYLGKNPDFDMYLCMWSLRGNGKYLLKFGSLCVERFGTKRGYVLTIPQRQFVVKEAIKYCKSKIN